MTRGKVPQKTNRPKTGPVRGKGLGKGEMARVRDHRTAGDGRGTANPTWSKTKRTPPGLSWTSLVPQRREQSGDVVGEGGLGFELLAGQPDGDVLQGA